MKKTIITIALYFSAIFLALRLIIPAAINNADFILIEPSNQKYISYLFDKDLVDFSWETVSIVGSRGFINTISEFRLVNPKDNLLSYTEIRNYASVEQLETEMEHLTEETNFGVIKDHNSLIVFSANSPELAETLNVFDVEDYPVNEAAVLKALSNNAYTHY
jgi:hypothetical protein